MTAALWLVAASSASAQSDEDLQEPPGGQAAPAVTAQTDSVLVPPPSAATAAEPKPNLRAVEEIVTLDAGASCLERHRLVERVARWLERTAVQAPLRVHVRGDPRVSTRVFFSVSTAPGASAERRLDNVPSDCDQMHSAVALSIALAIEATLEQSELARARAPLEPRRPEGPPAAPMHLELAILGGSAIGLVTDASWAATPRLSFAPWPWFELALSGLGAFLEDQPLANRQGRFSTYLLAGGLDACVGGETTQRLGFFMCAGARLGTFQSKGSNVGSGSGRDRDLRRAEFWWGITGSGQGRFWLSSVFALGSSVEVVYALRERRLTVREGGVSVPIQIVPRLGLSVTAGPVFRFF